MNILLIYAVTVALNLVSYPYLVSTPVTKLTPLQTTPSPLVIKKFKKLMFNILKVEGDTYLSELTGMYKWQLYNHIIYKAANFNINFAVVLNFLKNRFWCVWDLKNNE